MTLTIEDLQQFTGTCHYYRFNKLIPNFVLTDGTKYLAEKAGAYWLMDEIAFRLPKVKHLDIQFWEFKKDLKPGVGILTCVKDTGLKPIVEKHIPTDFFNKCGEDSIQLWVALGDENTWVIYLPSEH